MKKNILFVANWDSNVGYAWWLMENFWSTIANKFSAKGHQCFLIYPTISTIPDTIQSSPITIIQHDYDDDSRSGQKSLQSIIKQNNIAYIYLTDKPGTSIKYLLQKFWGIKKIIIHDHTPGERPKLSRFKRLYTNLQKSLPLINADYFIAVTPFVKNRMIYSSGIPKKRCFVAKNGIKPIGRNPEYQYYCHDKFNIPRDATIIITTGRATYYKRINIIIEGFATVLRENSIKNLYCIYCGDGPHINEFKHQVKKEKITEHFLFAGLRNDVAKLLQSCHIGIQASQGEVGYSLSILEYMSAGLATLTPNNPSTNQSITDKSDGLHFEADNAQSLAYNLLILINNKDYREQLGKNAASTINKHFHIDTTNKNLLSIFSSIVN